MRYFLIGFMGSGKTYWGKNWSEQTGIVHIDLDTEIERQTGKSVTALFEEIGETAFRKIEKAMLDTFVEKDHYILSCGGGTPCFHSNMKRMNHAGVTIYLKASAIDLAQRVQHEKETRPLIANIKDEVLVEFIEGKLKEREPYYAKAMYHLPAQHLSTDNFERIIRRHGK